MRVVKQTLALGAVPPPGVQRGAARGVPGAAPSSLTLSPCLAASKRIVVARSGHHHVFGRRRESADIRSMVGEPRLVKRVPSDAIIVLNPIIEALICRTVAERNLRYQTAKYVV